MGRMIKYQSKLDKIFNRLVEAAKIKASCPTNYELADLVNVSSPSSISDMLRAMEKDELITVIRNGGNRQIVIRASGDRTGWTDQKAARQLRAEDRIDPLTLPKVNRDPCGFCGTRGDLPCPHKPAWRLAELNDERIAA